jgi:hypothetical protein
MCGGPANKIAVCPNYSKQKGDSRHGDSESSSASGRTLKMAPKFAKAYLYSANVHSDSGQYDRTWDDVHDAQDLGHQIIPGFLKVLCEVSERGR